MKMTTRLFLCVAMASVLAIAFDAHAGSLTLRGPFSDDASTGISTSKTYTHAISGGTASSINGVTLEALNPNTTPANFDWNTNGLNKNQIGCCNNSSWDPTSGGVTGPDLITTLGSFTFSSNGDTNPASQTFTLSGLTPGYTYATDLYIRAWNVDPNSSGRPIDFTFTNGSEVDVLADFVFEDRATLVGMPTDHSAYAIAYEYTAESSDISIDTLVGAVGGGASGSFHMYALTNELVAIPEPGALVLMGMACLGLVSLRRRRR